MSRTVAVAPSRLARWFAGFAERNGEIDSIRGAHGQTVVTTRRGGTAIIEGIERSGDSIEALIESLRPSGTAVVVLIRRGGYSIATATVDGDAVTVTRSKTGSRYVQGRTAAGGQSQQRFARRRANQTAALVGSAVDTARHVLGDHPAPVDLLVTGGDLPLVDVALAARPLATLARDRQVHVQVGEPRRADIDRALASALEVTIVVTNADEETGA